MECDQTLLVLSLYLCLGCLVIHPYFLILVSVLGLYDMNVVSCALAMITVTIVLCLVLLCNCFVSIFASLLICTCFSIIQVSIVAIVGGLLAIRLIATSPQFFSQQSPTSYASLATSSLIHHFLPGISLSCSLVSESATSLHSNLDLLLVYLANHSHVSICLLLISLNLLIVSLNLPLLHLFSLLYSTNLGFF